MRKITTHKKREKNKEKTTKQITKAKVMQFQE